ncbi:DNA polymerase IV [Methanoculleus sp. Wushi-C6]|uniref:DNA polymerase IV n=1 Tax=Methanoculleus caldifontis TaxID=2651577 RepID=A0ABU3WZW1_9EURY|nr:DNA polymerase IV [Methanoculleus sp. Wushi-C6]MDV2481342.1 DNA polymerase IV [Methanoculleus sp. Wushi-C6]
MTTGGRIILHVDMDSFFASVEVRRDPSLAGRPVIVGADPKGGTGRGVVSTCSYEARRYGVRSGMPISRAYDLCPHGVYLPVDRPLYAGASAEIMAILSRHADRIEQVSIDEAYLDVSSAGSFPAARALAAAIKREVREEAGLTCSVGVAPGKAVAKIASDYEKPDGLTIVAPEEVAGFLAPLPVEKIPGIGRKTGEDLRQMGVLTVGDLARCDVQDLISRFGRAGIQMHRLARGIDDREVRDRGGCRSVSRETTFDADTADPSTLSGTLLDLAGDVAGTLAADGLRCRTVTVKVRYRGFETHTRSRTLERFSDDPGAIRRAASALLLPFLNGRPVRLIGVRLSTLEGGRTRQASIDEFLS